MVGLGIVEPTEAENAEFLSLGERVDRAVALLRENEPQEGYWLAFSGGKDSVVIKHLAQRAGVRFDAVYNDTTIDPPELVRFIKQSHKDVAIQRQQEHSLLWMVANTVKGPPTRTQRWCCEKYKEGAGLGRSKVIGVRAAESQRRARLWKEVVSHTTDKASRFVCPIVYWTDDDVWTYIEENSIPTCSLYRSGCSRLGCVGCPLAGTNGMKRDFERWPQYERAWKRAVFGHWTNFKDNPKKDGGRRYVASFPTPEAFWEWWISGKSYVDETCQMELMWT